MNTKILVLTGFMLASLSGVAVQAQQQEVEGPPHRTLIAPFEYSGGEVKDLSPLGIKGETPEDVETLDAAHRSTKDVGEWVMGRSSELLTFEGGNFQETLNQKRPLFSSTGFGQYTTFLQEQGFTRALESQRYAIRSFAQDIPVLLNEGSVGQRYRWLYEIPVMVTFLDKNAKDYTRAQALNKELTLTVQVGRTEDSDDGEGLMVERWRAVATKKDTGR